MIDVLLLLAPALVLLCALLAGSYPGERTIATLAGRRSRRCHPRATAATVGAGRDPLPLPRGGRLVAAAIAARPPPGWMPHT